MGLKKLTWIPKFPFEIHPSMGWDRKLSGLSAPSLRVEIFTPFLHWKHFTFIFIFTFSIFLQAVPDDNLLKNGEFQRWKGNSPTEWSFSSSPPNAKGCTLERSKSEKSEEKLFLKMKLSTSDWFVLRQDPRCNAGEKYKAQVRYKILNGIDKLKVVFDLETGSGLVDKKAQTNLTAIDGWITREIVFQIPENSLLTQYGIKFAVTGNSEILVDYISLEHAQ